ncbi:MAG: DUF4326 domain-containing protein [Candidatus Promineifilaceae bacterium]
MCTVVNFKQYGSKAALDRAFGDRWLNIGRANSYAGLPRSPLANPYRARDFGGRGRTLLDSRRWLWGRIQAGDEGVINALRGISEEAALVCWCRPEPCHGDVVRAAAA